MRIHDKHGGEHAYSITDKLTLGSHVVSHLRRQGNALTIHDYSIPINLQGLGLGSALLQELERQARQRGIRDLRVKVDPNCPIHAHFWTKHGFEHTGSVWHKVIKRGF